MRVLIAGAEGQAGVEAVQAAPPGTELLACGSGELNIADGAQVRACIRRFRPHAVINCAAYTAVDRAESEARQALAANRDGPAHLAAALAASGGRLVHVSTDYVFDGRKPGAYREEDAPNPLNLYGRSKLAGEQAIRRQLKEHLILRAAWVFGRLGRSFVDAMLRLAGEREELAVVDDQRGGPTPATALAKALWRLALKSGEDGFAAWGTYHLESAPILSWHGFAQRIFADALELGLIAHAPRLRPIASRDYPTAAARPANSALSGRKLEAAFGIPPIAWVPELRRYLEELAARQAG